MNRILLLVGAMQGWALWALWKAREIKVWPAVDPLSERALLYLSLALPLGFYLTQNIETLSRNRRIKFLLWIGTLFTFLGGYSGWAENIPVEPSSYIWSNPPARSSDLLAAGILGFIFIPLLVHFEYSTKRWSYHSLFETAWRNALMTVSSLGLTGVFWIVLFAGSMLMQSIGVNFISELIKKPIFSIPVTGIVFGAAFALSLARSQMIVTLRRFWLSISSWLLPLLLAFSIIWVVALPFTGLELLFKTRNACFILLWFVALSINFVNAAYQDGAGEQPYGELLSKLLQYAWFSLIALVVVAWWAMMLRINQYGWTEERVWGVFVLVLTTLYVVGYAYSVRSSKVWFSNIGVTNIATSLVMSMGLILLLSPIADARRIAVHSQMLRLMSGQVEPEKIDYAYFRWQAGRYGQDALQTLADGINHKDRDIISSKAKQTLAQKQRYETKNGAESLTVEQMRQRLRVAPQGEKLDDSLIKVMQSGKQWQESRCMATDVQCLVWMIDLNNDGLKEAVVIIIEKQGLPSGNAIFYNHLSKDQYRYGGWINFGYGNDQKLREKLIADIEQGKVKTTAPKFNDIEIEGKRISVIATE